jgi:hypothetical protein
MPSPPQGTELFSISRAKGDDGDGLPPSPTKGNRNLGKVLGADGMSLGSESGSGVNRHLGQSVKDALDMESSHRNLPEKPSEFKSEAGFKPLKSKASQIGLLSGGKDGIDECVERSCVLLFGGFSRKNTFRRLCFRVYVSTWATMIFLVVALCNRSAS